MPMALPSPVCRPVFRSLQRPRALCLAAVLALTACAPVPHSDGTVGGDSAIVTRVGDAALSAGNPETAIPLYRRAHSIDPLNPAPLLRLASALHEIGAYHEAAEAWSRAIRLEPANTTALRGYAGTLLALGKPALALRQIERGLEIMPSAELYNALGVSQDMLGHADTAQLAYRAGLKMAPDHAGLLNNLGLSLALSGHNEESIAILETSTKRAQASRQHRQNLALAYALAGFNERALTIAREDFDEIVVARNMAFYATLKTLPRHADRVAAVGTYNNTVSSGLLWQ